MILLNGGNGSARNAAAGYRFAGSVAMTKFFRCHWDENACCPPVSVREI